MRAFTAAAIQVAPVPGPLTAGSVKSNVDKCVAMVEQCVAATGAELVVLPETASTGFTPGVPTDAAVGAGRRRAGRGDRADPGGGGAAGRARGLRHVRAWDRPETVYNTAVLIGPRGDVLGAYRKTHLFCGENRADGGWVTPGDGGRRRAHRAGLDRADHLLRRRLPGAVPGDRDPRRRGDLPAVGAAALGRHLGADQPGPRLRQPRLRGRRQRHRHRPGRRDLLRQLDDRDADRPR